MIEKAFDFEKKNRSRFVVPEWFSSYWRPDAEALKYWTWQYSLAKKGKDHKLPDDRMRMPSNRLHQMMAEDFAKEVIDSYGDFSTILDVGCSDGYMVNYFKNHGYQAKGIDETVYPTDQLYIEENVLSVREMDMHNLEFNDGEFDAVWCRHTLEHSFAPMQVLSEISRVTKTGGLLFCILPPPPEPSSRYLGHWHQIPTYQLEYLLEMAGYRVLNIKTAYFSYQRENDNLEIRAVARKD